MKIHILTAEEECPEIALGLQHAGFDVTWGGKVPPSVEWVLTPREGCTFLREKSLTRLTDTLRRVTTRVIE